MNYLSDIRAFFADKLNTYQSTNVAWENTPFDPATPDYITFTIAQSDVNQLEYGTYGRDERKGIVTINVMKPNNGGSGPALTKAEAIAALFYRGLSGVQNDTKVLVRKAVVGPAIQTNIHYAVPVSIYWQSITPPVGV